jgi:hypothetical protein
MLSTEMLGQSQSATPYVVLLITVVLSLAGTIVWAIGFRSKRADDYSAKLERRNVALESRVETLEGNLEEAEEMIDRLERDKFRLLQELYRERNGKSSR